MAKYTYSSNIRMLDVNPEIVKLSGDRIAEITTKQLGIAFSETEKAYPEWEIVSHSLLNLGNHLIVSFLLRQPKH
jgi:hypothetical protein